MKIGLRTIKTVIASVLAILIATQLHLLYATAAGIIAILSVGNTKKTSLKSGLGRVLSLGLAIILSFICFTTLGFHTWAFGVFLLVFIPLSVRFNLADAIVVNSVLITHFLVEKSFSWQMILNETLLMTIGVGLALLLNLYMPDNEKQLKEDIKAIEEDFRTIIFAMAAHLNLEKMAPLDDACLDLRSKLRAALNQAHIHQKNQWISEEDYYSEYFSMRLAQLRILRDMVNLLIEIDIDGLFVDELRKVLISTAENFAEENDGKLILWQIEAVYQNYRQKPLPQTREEFENRALLFQFLQSFRSFVEIKAIFYQNEQKI
ncbi:aromatic acid exporter family protein [Enterococcus cecorum]|uniref:Aromatic acid exporter family protein n=1 Tax=Enterococcus cecorum TaxID=44008 RepID=A0AAW8TPB9_9ENTE|nr:aromatic acid exporter family protein [Enterococcus cecorum]MDT2796027.1 aromatic acid exporter family protein [Enterococcus cecorum]MDZ5501267.1 aromatic acid exporter family protein [Enterococcus cecorum]MDZ5508679.1 aromatic acid exporter family protein [Enterococcus cecorum]MDZ5555134.1 aromatic acid exporter family protein [Enterococcus cecorum]MDZ5557501.1 aromatic acid exporter family protein [Enterococcus cecorum]